VRRPLVDGQGELSSFQRALRCLSLAALLLLATPAGAQVPAAEAGCAEADTSFIFMRTPSPSESSPVAWPEVVRHVRSELALRRIGLCMTPQRRRPLAELRLEEQPPSSLRISLWSVDPPETLGERSLDLAPIPSDARLLAIAVAADELLGANFLELDRRAERARSAPENHALPTAPPPPRPAPEPRFDLGPGFVYESFDGGQALLGVDARLGLQLFGPLSVTARLGYRQGLPQQADHGSVHSSAFLGGLGLRLELVGEGRLKLDVLGRADAMRLNADAFPEAGASAREDAGTAVVLGGGPGLRVVLSRSLRLVVDVTAGGAVRPVHITDDGRRVSGASGLVLGAGGGVLAAF
jgi:hypothetical protein